jgi:hypothetical protein
MVGGMQSEHWVADYGLRTTFIDFADASKSISDQLLRGVRIGLPRAHKAFIGDIQYRLDEIDHIAQEWSLTNVTLSSALKVAEFFDKHPWEELSTDLRELRYQVAQGRGDTVDVDKYRAAEKLLDERIKQGLSAFVPSVSSRTIEQIRKCKRLSGAKTVSQLLHSYQELDAALSKIEVYVERVTREWERQIEMEIDISRGK